MTAIIVLALTIWAISAVTKSAKAKQMERNRQAQIARINAENMKRRAEAQRMREEWKARQLEAKLEVEHMVAIEREQIRMQKEAERQALLLEKHDKEIAKLQYRMDRAEDQIAHHSELFEMYSDQLDEAQTALEEVTTALYVVRYQIKHAQTLTEKKKEELLKEEKRTIKLKEQCENKVISLKNKKFSAEQKIKKAEADIADVKGEIA